MFSSSRERRLWGWTAAVVVAIYATLGVTRPLAGLLRDANLLGAAFIGGFLLVLATVAVQALRSRPGRREVGIGLGVLATALLVLVRIELAEERTHLIEYAVVAVFTYEALSERARQGRHVPVPALLAVLLTSVVGVVEEGIQGLMPSRVFDPRDLLFDGAAAVMAVSAVAALRWARGSEPSGR